MKNAIEINKVLRNRIIIGIIIAIIGSSGATFLGIGIMLNNKNILFVGQIIIGLLSLFVLIISIRRLSKGRL